MQKSTLVCLLRCILLAAVPVALLSVLILSPPNLPLSGGGDASAAPLGATFNCSYDAGNEEIDYSVSGGDAVTYTVTGGGSGSIEFTEALHDLTGPADSDDSSIRCTKKTYGQVKIDFKEGAVLLYSCSLCFKCAGADEKPAEVGCTVGGIAELPHVSDSSAPNYIAVVGLAVAAAAVALVGGGWYARRRLS